MDALKQTPLITRDIHVIAPLVGGVFRDHVVTVGADEEFSYHGAVLMIAKQNQEALFMSDQLNAPLTFDFHYRPKGNRRHSEGWATTLREARKQRVKARLQGATEISPIFVRHHASQSGRFGQFMENHHFGRWSDAKQFDEGTNFNNPELHFHKVSARVIRNKFNEVEYHK